MNLRISAGQYEAYGMPMRAGKTMYIWYVGSYAKFHRGGETREWESNLWKEIEYIQPIRNRP